MMSRWRLIAGACAVSVALVSVIGRAQTADTRATKALDNRVAQRFREFDRDADGRLTRSELGAVLFDELNVDGNDAVTLEEAQGVIRKRGLEVLLKAAQAGQSLTPKGTPQAGGPTAAVTPQSSSSAQSEEKQRPEEKQSPPLRQGPKRLIPEDNGVGRMIPDLTLRDLDDKQFRLSDFADKPAIVLAITNTSCPLSKKYLPSLAAIEKQFSDQKVQFVFVNSTASDKLPAIRSAVAANALSGPYVRDPDGAIARAIGATHTTDVIVLDSRRTVIYRGAVDDQYGFEYSLETPRNEYLKRALGALLERRPLLVAATEAPGCPLDLTDAPAASIEMTFHNRISRILQARCLECHREGGPAPFALDTYANVSAQSGAIRQAVERGVMPPWFAARPEKGMPSHFANDRSLSDQEKTDLLAWLSHGKPEGDAKDAPLPREFASGWRIGAPEHIVQLPKPMPVKATGIMAYQNVIVDAGIDSDRWVRGMEIRPTAPQVVHHVLVFLLPPADRSSAGSDRNAGDDESGGFFIAYAPGNDALIFSEGYGKKLPAGSRLKFQIHYTPNGTATEDQTRVGFVFSDREPTHIVSVAGIANPRLSIPPGADNHEVNATQTLNADTTIMAFFPHMHLRGKAFRYEAQYPDGRTETLLDVPRYDFNWQLSYRLAQPLELPKGTTLQLTGWYDNSKNNPANPDPTRTVKWGQQTFDEMMLGYVEYYTTSPTDAPAMGNRNLETLFRQFDRNQDGKLSGDEFPKDWKERLLKLDADADGNVTLEELQQGVARRRRTGS